MKFKLLYVLLLSGLSACAQMPANQAADKTGESTEQDEVSDLNLPKQELTASILFDFLVGETALQRGNLDIAINRYIKLTRTTRDPRLAKRATEISLHAGNPIAAEQAATMWIELEPDSVDARQTIAALLVNLGKLEAAKPHLEKLLASQTDQVGNAFMQLNQLLSRNPDRAATLRLVQYLSQPYKDSPEVHFAVSQAAWFANQHQLAQDEMQRALALRPDWEVAAVHNGRILQRISVTDAGNFYRDYLQKFPVSNEVRIAYARLLIGDNQLDQARTNPMVIGQNAKIRHAATGLLAAEWVISTSPIEPKKSVDLATKTPTRYISTSVRYEETNRPDMAMESYQMVSGSRFCRHKSVTPICRNQRAFKRSAHISAEPAGCQ